MVDLVLLVCGLMVTTKKVVNFFEQEKCTPRGNSGYAYGSTSDQIRISSSADVTVLPPEPLGRQTAYV